MKTIYSFLAAITILMVLAPMTVHAQEPEPIAIPSVLPDWRLSVDSLAAERAESVPSVVVRNDWTRADALLGSHRGVSTETVRLTKTGRARFPVANYALRVVAAQACVQRVPNTETARCFPRKLNGTPVTRYPGLNTDEPLVPPDRFVQRPDHHTP